MTNVDHQARIRLAAEGVVASYIHDLARRAAQHGAPDRGRDVAAPTTTVLHGPPGGTPGLALRV